jgi:surface antigen
VLAAIHNVETGGSFNPKGSLVSGRIIGDIEPDIGKVCITRVSAKAKYAVPVETGCGFDSLLNSALYAAEHFKEKMSYAKNIARPGASDFELISAAFALYNGPGNTQCIGNTPKPETGGLYTGCAPKFLFEDHLYPFACFDERHAKMYTIYCGDGRKCATLTPYKNIGAITFIKALQQKIASQKNPSSNEIKLTTPSPTMGVNGIRPTQIFPQPVVCNQATGLDSQGNLCIGSNSSAQVIVDDIKSKCLNGTINASNANCIYAVSSLNAGAKSIINYSATKFDDWGGLQCVGFAAAMGLQLNGAEPPQSNACSMAFNSAKYKFIPRTSGPPQAGDLIIWNSAGNICTADHVGHIAYISRVINSNNIVVTEANVSARGTVGTRNIDINNLTKGWLRRR